MTRNQQDTLTFIAIAIVALALALILGALVAYAINLADFSSLVGNATGLASSPFPGAHGYCPPGCG